jgi:hypothetical protein
MSRPVRLGTEYQLTPVRARRLYNLINESVFRNQLTPCEIVIRPLRSAWGWCVGLEKRDEFYCKIELPPRWPFEQYAITALAHEMCHQFQWENLTSKRHRQGLPAIMSHGPSFFLWRDALARQGIPLNVSMHHPVTFLEKHLATLH